MKRLLISSLSALALIGVAAGCQKDAGPAKSGTLGRGASPTTAAVVTAAPSLAAVTADDVVGKWKATTIEGGTGFPDGLKKTLLDQTYDVRANHTYVANSSAMGRTNGTWQLSGGTLTLTPAANQTLLRPVALAVEKPRLANRDKLLSILYERTGPASVAATEPQYKLTAAALLDEVKDDAAVKKYNEALVEITGYVTSVDPRATGIYVYVAGPPKTGQSVSDLFLGLSCTPADAEVWAKVGPRQKIRVVGVAQVVKGYAQLNEAKFTLDGPSIMKATTAEELAAEFAKDESATTKKYTGESCSSIILTGTVLEKQINSGRESVLILGKGDAKVICNYANGGNDSKKDLEPIKVGQTVKLAGHYNRYPSGTAKLDNCLLITN